MTRPILLTILVVCAALCILSYTALGLFWMAGGSDSVLRIVRPSVVEAVAICALMAVPIALFSVMRDRRLTLTGSFLLLIVPWLLCGRWVGVFADGRIRAGLYMFETSTIELKAPGEESEHFFVTTSFAQARFQRLYLRHGEQHEMIFIGPIIMKRTLTLFREVGFHQE